jgi:beta-lactamase regulating signal transducer with metallopeptidase domain
MSSVSLVIPDNTAGTIARYLLVVGLKSSLLFATAGILAFAMRRRAAAARHLIWIGAIIGAAVLPVVGAFVPRWNLPVLSAPRASQVAPSETQRAETGIGVGVIAAASQPVATDLAAPTVASLGTWARAGSPHVVHFDGAVVVLLAWALGTLWFLSRMALSILALTRLRRRAAPVTDPAWVQTLEDITGGRRRVALLMSDEVDIPLTWGILWPIILLPREANEWSPSRRELVLRHELAHVDRHDVLSQLVARLVRAFHWLNPLAWIAERNVRRECEQACDDMVLAAGVRPTRYAEELLEIACELIPRGVASLAPGLASRPSLEVRLRALLDTRSTRRHATRLDAAVIAAGALSLVLPLAAMRPAERGAPLEHTHRSRVVTPALPVAPTLVARGASAATLPRLRPLIGVVLRSSRVAMVTQLCTSNGGSHSNSTEEHNGTKKWEVHWSGRDCAVDLRAEGDIKFDDDLTDIASISRDGFFDLSVRDGDDLTRLVVRPAGEGELDRRYTVNGAARPWDGRAREWFADFLLQLDRQTGFAVDVRFPRLLASGVPAVLDEIKMSGGDYVRGLYFQRLIDRATLSQSQVRQTLELAGHELRSDYELARILVAVADHYGLPDEATRTVYLGAVNSLRSDYERNRALQALLARSDLSSREAAAVLQSASALTSDYELARTLVAMTDKRLISPPLRALYLDDAGKITSDYERARVVIALLGTGKLSDTEVARVIGLASGIKSDYDRARVLVAVAGAYDLGDDARDAYVKAARSISSDYERGRALSALRGR